MGYGYIYHVPLDRNKEGRRYSNPLWKQSIHLATRVGTRYNQGMNEMGSQCIPIVGN